MKIHLEAQEIDIDLREELNGLYDGNLFGAFFSTLVDNLSEKNYDEVLDIMKEKE